MNGCGTLHGKETRNKGQGGEDGDLANKGLILR